MKYGMPESEYIINGDVSDKSNGNSIQNIRIIRHLSEDYGDTVYTNQEGKYGFRFYNNETAYLIVEDIDGEENGGNFASQEIYVQFTSKDIVHKGKDNNKYSKTQNIELERK
jgi:putative lipoprotein (rSAM/lipoprotein system)